MTRYRISLAGALFLLGFLWLSLGAQTPKPSPEQNALMQGFKNPPNSARPRVWWHWMNGNITPDGIQLDLHWMSRIGLGGFTVFEGAIDTPQVVKERLIYMTPAWKEAFRQAVSTAKSLGLEVAIASSPGWSETGGPWVPPAQAMKKLVWSSTHVEGGKPFTGTLSLPPKTTGTFQNYSEENHRQGEASASAVSPPLPQFYADSAVIAYRVPDGDKTQAELNPLVTSSGGTANVPAMSDGDVDNVALALPASAPGEKAWVQFDYGRPQTTRAITLATIDDIISFFEFDENAPALSLAASDDGQNFRKIADIPASSVPQRTTSFEPVTARFFRLTFPATPPAGKNEKPVVHQITELVLSNGARVNAFEKKAGFSTVRDYYAIPNPSEASDLVIPQQDVVDLTSRMKPDGSLDWTPPAGKWMILRMGYSLTGHRNGPAPAEATGLEVDKFNRQYVKNYLDSYLKTYSDTVGSTMMGKSGIGLMLTDSTEVGAQNWTDNMLSEFRQRRGYDAHLWLPALTGVVIVSPEATDRFLWDFRRTIAELTAQNHYGEISAELHRRGMGYYGEALEYHRPSLGDDIEIRSKTTAVPTL